ncbi:MAG: hypothetical protein IK041_06055 [Bacteroidales bacterium]|nr:hypothetical protein [Bacteroidales bacterium]
MSKFATFEYFVIEKEESGSIRVFKTYDNTKDALRTIAKEAGFDYDEKWNTRTFGAKLIDFLNSK